MEVSLNYYSQNGGNLYRAPYYNRNPNIGPRFDSNLGQFPCATLTLIDASKAHNHHVNTSNLGVASDVQWVLQKKRSMHLHTELLAMPKLLLKDT